MNIQIINIINKINNSLKNKIFHYYFKFGVLILTSLLINKTNILSSFSYNKKRIIIYLNNSKKNIKFISKPSKTYFFKYKKIKHFDSIIVSTNKGIFLLKEAVNNKLGGILLFKYEI
ncbi:30S ribosomal protein S8 [Candidatus Vidania fulgoroideorum]